MVSFAGLCSSGQDGPISIANTPDHGLIILGTSNGSGGDVPFHYGSMWTFDWVLIKTDSVGTVIWSKDIGTSNDEGSSGAILTIDSAYYLISNTGSIDHDCTDTAWHHGALTGFDLYVLKIDALGNILWDSSYGGSNTDGANFALFDPRDSTIVINGFTYSNDYMVTGYQGAEDIWVVKIDKTGKLLWQKTLGSPNEEVGTGICIANSGGYLAYGWTHPGTGGGDGLIFTLDSSGSEVNSKIIGGAGYDISSIIVPYLNGYVATGNSESKVFLEGTTYGNFDTSSIDPSGGGIFISYLDSVTLGLTKLSKDSEQAILVYPNPADGTVTINLQKNELGSITIINDIGQIVYKESVKIQHKYIDIGLSDWSNGIYFVVWNSENGIMQTAKFVKK